jgi:hypothetical protein
MCSAQPGAILVLRSPATRADFTDNAVVRSYISQNIDSWYEYARTVRKYDVPEGSLVLIKGCDKTSSWAHAAFTEPCKEARISFSGSLIKDYAGSVIALYGSWAPLTPAICRELPLSRSDHDRLILRNVPPLVTDFPPECVYTVFARYYECERRSGVGPIKRSVKITLNA